MVDPRDDVTELSGIGSSTKEKLEEKGISTVGDLADYYQQPNPDLPNSRVESAARGAAMDLSLREEGEFDDPRTGVTVTENNRQAFEHFAEKEVTESSVFDGRDLQHSRLDPDDSMATVGKAAEEGKLFNFVPTPRDDDGAITTDYAEVERPDYSRAREKAKGAKMSVEEARQKMERKKKRDVGRVHHALDVAANLFGSDRETLREANELREKTETKRNSKAKTIYSETYTREVAGEEKQFERDIRVGPREIAAARETSKDRPPKAQRVDDRRAAPVTNDVDKWQSNPAHYDFPAVDTKESPEEVLKGDARAERTLSKAEKVMGADKEVRERVLGDLL